MAERGRSRGRRGVLAALIAVALLVVLVAWELARPPEGVVVALTALDDGTAAIVIRSGHEPGASRFWLARLGRGGLPLAWRELDGQYETVRGASALVAVGDALHVRLEREGQLSIAAFSLEGLTPRWRTNIASTASPEARGDSLFLAGGLLLAPTVAGESATLVAVSPQSGDVAWRAELPGGEERAVGAPLVAGGTLVVSQSWSVWTLRTSDGALLRSLPHTAFAACVGEHGEAWADVDRALVALAEDSREDRVVLSSTVLPGGAVADGCGTRRGVPILQLTRGHQSWLVGADGDAPWTIELPGWIAASLGSGQFDGRTPLTAPATRYLPLVLSRRSDPQGQPRYDLAIVDVDGRHVSATRDLAGYAPTLAATIDDRHYVAAQLGTLDLEIDLIDGGSGRLIAAARVAPFSATEFDPAAIAGGRLWTISGEAARADALGVLVLDAATLEPLVSRGSYEAVDVSAEARERWPAPP